MSWEEKWSGGDEMMELGIWVSRFARPVIFCTAPFELKSTDY